MSEGFEVIADAFGYALLEGSVCQPVADGRTRAGFAFHNQVGTTQVLYSPLNITCPTGHVQGKSIEWPPRLRGLGCNCAKSTPDKLQTSHVGSWSSKNHPETAPLEIPKLSGGISMKASLDACAYGKARKGLRLPSKELTTIKDPLFLQECS